MLSFSVELKIVCGSGRNICMNDCLASLPMFRDSL